MSYLLRTLMGIFALGLFSSTHAIPGPFDSVVRSTSLNWQGCELRFPGLSCAVLDVPLDYSLPLRTRASLPIVKISATTTPYKGMIFVNPGGPGGSAIEWLRAYGTQVSDIVGTNYDVVAFEPRGIGYSEPLAECSVSVVPRQVAERTTPVGPRLTSEFYEDEYAYQQALSYACANAIGGQNQAGPHMTTSTVVRDVISILDAYAASNYSAGVQNPKEFNFWGLSYGTIIGQTFAQMYPNRVGRFVLDGVVDANDYYAGQGLTILQFADRALSTFFEYCSKAGPVTTQGGCFFWRSTPQAVFSRFEALVQKLDAKKAFQENWANKTVIQETLKAVKYIGTDAIAYPVTEFPRFAFMLYTLESIIASGLTLEALAMAEIGPIPRFANDQWAPAIGCPDTGNKALGQTLQQTQSVTSQLEKQSWISGEVFSATRIACTAWSIRPKSRYTGSFGGSTKTPILFVGNTIDSRTPLDNAVKATSIYKNSRLLTIAVVGHTSFYVGNSCGVSKIKAYFQTGQLATTFCAQEPGPFNVLIAGSLSKRNQQRIVARLSAFGG